MRKHQFLLLLILLGIKAFAQTSCPVAGGTAISGTTQISAPGVYYITSGSTWSGTFNIANLNNPSTVKLVVCSGGTWNADNLTAINSNIPLTLEVVGTLNATSINLNNQNIAFENYGTVNTTGDFRLENIKFNNYPTGTISASNITIAQPDPGSKNEGSLIATNYVEISEGDIDNSGSITAHSIYLHSSGFVNESTGTITSTATNCSDPTQTCGLYIGTKNTPLINLGTMTTQYFGVSSSNSISQALSTGKIKVGTEVTCPDQNNIWSFFCSIGTPTSLIYNTCSSSQPSSTMQCTQVVPLQLLTFEGEQNNNTINLQWVTTNEVNFSHFEIESSDDGLSFNKIAKVSTPEKVSAGMKLYNLNGLRLLSLVTYFRLKMIDVDGQVEYSKVISFKSLVDEISVYPNPLIGNVLHVDIPKNEGSIVSLYGIDGKLLKRIETLKAESLEVDISEIRSSGKMILVEILSPNRSEQFRVVLE